MPSGKVLDDALVPIFILADDDREATQRFLERANEEWFYVAVPNPRQVVCYAKRFATTAVFLSEPISYPKGGAAKLLQELLDEVESPVIVLTEEWGPGVTAKWKRMGASDCLLHPTRVVRKMESVRAKMQELALRSVKPKE